ncbi:FadR/GntR family transcriptional regulator [Lysinibacter cavernae]|uniref:DNA-binding FadR family transcriptional regulator n=1 Tax=Lysinibacter cavernae TaxID=1640652 RepID=A0A7X5R3F6_9MICO|nr:FCD domain-containing protein [Lysinibacter cavernae]NIH54045.1 DNA-binding FadR family transcriptional regulator [Lysinibacter cavernae]NIH54948.1 DNA-binding FadR family transcriptional regulator [Lysinibacter cavernae]
MTTPKAWELVLAHIEAQLSSGELSPGDHLPGERALAADLDVGRSSVREALRVLEALGLIRTQTGSGPTSGAIIVSRPSGGMSMLMRLQVAAQGFAVRDVVKTRLILESAVARELATASSPNLDEPKTLLEAMEQHDLTETEYLLLDAQYHLSLAEAAGNDVLTSTMAGLRSAIEHYVIDASASLPDWATTARRLQHEHRGILESIEAKDADTASDRITAHISGYYAETQISDHQTPEG